MTKNFIKAFTISLISLLFLSSSVFAAKPAPSTSGTQPLGIDISWPQCGKTVPKTQAFGVVGINGGLATTTNSCLKDQLVWARASLGGTSQEKIQLYANTANPGGLNTASWPSNNIDPAGNASANPYGTCDHGDSRACAWQYGWNRAVEDVLQRFQPAATAAGISTSPSGYIWWLDVETQNTWKTGGTAADYQSNVAVLEGMTSYFTNSGGRVGLYSTAAQWGQIAGNQVGSASNLNGLKNWRPGGASQATAKDACKAAPLTAGGSVVLTQFVSKSIDYDYSCV
jgi:hypothetical protein